MQAETYCSPSSKNAAKLAIKTIFAQPIGERCIKSILSVFDRKSCIAIVAADRNVLLKIRRSCSTEPRAKSR